MNQEQLNIVSSVFIRWLAHKDALGAWCDNSNLYLRGEGREEGFHKDRHPRHIINYSFSWLDTEEGLTYWRDLDREWGELATRITRDNRYREVGVQLEEVPW